jgi:FkbM family methyltransferase
MEKIKDMFLFLKHISSIHLIIFDYLGLLRNKLYKIRLRNGVLIFLRSNTNDKGRVKEILIKQPYFRNENELESGNITVFDVGANIGCFSLSIAKKNPEARVYAFEPEAANYEMLSKSITANRFTNIQSFHVGLASADKKFKLRLALNNTGGHSIVDEAGFLSRNKISENFEEVDVISFENFIRTHNISKIDFLKMDIEGGEYDIFFHLSDETFNMISIISMEYHFIDDNNNGDRLKELFENKGYSVSMNYPMIYAVKSK